MGIIFMGIVVTITVPIVYCNYLVITLRCDELTGAEHSERVH